MFLPPSLTCKLIFFDVNAFFYPFGFSFVKSLATIPGMSFALLHILTCFIFDHY